MELTITITECLFLECQLMVGTPQNKEHLFPEYQSRGQSTQCKRKAVLSRRLFQNDYTYRIVLWFFGCKSYQYDPFLLFSCINSAKLESNFMIRKFLAKNIMHAEYFFSP